MNFLQLHELSITLQQHHNHTPIDIPIYSHIPSNHDSAICYTHLKRELMLSFSVVGCPSWCRPQKSFTVPELASPFHNQTTIPLKRNARNAFWLISWKMSIFTNKESKNQNSSMAKCYLHLCRSYQQALVYEAWHWSPDKCQCQQSYHVACGHCNKQQCSGHFPNFFTRCHLSCE